MKAAAHAELPDLLAKAPLALRHVLRNPQSLPEGVPEELDAAGLLQRANGQRVEIRFGRGHTRPYGKTGLNR